MNSYRFQLFSEVVWIEATQHATHTPLREPIFRSFVQRKQLPKCEEFMEMNLCSPYRSEVELISDDAVS